MFHFPLGESMPCASTLLFHKAKQACAFALDITSRWEALLTNPDPNHKVSHILKDKGFVRSLVASLHPHKLPILQCVISKGKSWRAPGGYGILGPALSEALAVASLSSHGKPLKHRKLERTRPQEKLEYLCCESVLGDVVTSKWWKSGKGEKILEENGELERIGIAHYAVLKDVNPMLDDEHCEDVRVKFEQACKKGYGRTLHSQMNLFDVPDFLSTMSIRSCVRTKKTTDELDRNLISRYKQHKTILVCTVSGYPEPWQGIDHKWDHVLVHDGAASASGSGHESMQHRLKRQRMKALEKKKVIGLRGKLLAGISVESQLLGKIDEKKEEKVRMATNIEYWRNLLLFKKLFRDNAEEVECYDKLPVHIGVCVCEDPIQACDMAGRFLDRKFFFNFFV